MAKKSPLDDCISLLRLLQPKAENDHEMHIAHQAIEHYFERRGCRTQSDRFAVFLPLQARYSSGGYGENYIVQYMDKLAAELSAPV